MSLLFEIRHNIFCDAKSVRMSNVLREIRVIWHKLQMNLWKKKHPIAILRMKICMQWRRSITHHGKYKTGANYCHLGAIQAEDTDFERLHHWLKWLFWHSEWLQVFIWLTVCSLSQQSEKSSEIYYQCWKDIHQKLSIDGQLCGKQAGWTTQFSNSDKSLFT